MQYQEVKNKENLYNQNKNKVTSTPLQGGIVHGMKVDAPKGIGIFLHISEISGRACVMFEDVNCVYTDFLNIKDVKPVENSKPEGNKNTKTIKQGTPINNLLSIKNKLKNSINILIKEISKITTEWPKEIFIYLNRIDYLYANLQFVEEQQEIEKRISQIEGYLKKMKKNESIYSFERDKVRVSLNPYYTDYIVKHPKITLESLIKFESSIACKKNRLLGF